MTQPHDGTEPDRADFERLVAEHEAAKAELADSFAGLEAQIDAHMIGAARPKRRRLKLAKRKIAHRRATLNRMLDRKFNEITRGYDADTGTLKGVQEEAAAMLADVLDDAAR